MEAQPNQTSTGTLTVALKMMTDSNNISVAVKFFLELGKERASDSLYLKEFQASIPLVFLGGNVP